MKLRLSERAQQHYRDIEVYTVDTFGARQWLIYSAQLEQGFSTLRRFAGIGIKPSDLPEGVHAFRVREHWICYEIMGDTVLVSAIVRSLDQFDLGRHD